MRHAGRRRALPTLLPVLGLGAVLATGGCGDQDGAASAAPTARVAAAADCLAPQVLAALHLTPAPGTAASVPPSAKAHADVPAQGSVPDGFVATGALECTPGGPLVDSAGTWSSVKARRLDGDTTALLAALGSRAATADAGSCSAEPMDLWLVDALGRAVRVVVPAGRCERVRTALDGLNLTDATSYPVALLVASPAPSP
ncbi:hypothetical protein [Cellulomonas edaphi]|uniref:Uncharacterized protein n=1 Tax=Cellulomonas edaphi TaxID=3053468 RepID=A0ABT7S921_9CELL|nr:hypothetical protein [Cellulomons edaphi]MDM7832123.1 hypothetical protein [Cellulomons edaphi]